MIGEGGVACIAQRGGLPVLSLLWGVGKSHKVSGFRDFPAFCGEGIGLYGNSSH